MMNRTEQKSLHFDVCIYFGISSTCLALELLREIERAFSQNMMKSRTKKNVGWRLRGCIVFTRCSLHACMHACHWSDSRGKAALRKWIYKEKTARCYCVFHWKNLSKHVLKSAMSKIMIRTHEHIISKRFSAFQQPEYVSEHLLLVFIQWSPRQFIFKVGHSTSAWKLYTSRQKAGIYLSKLLNWISIVWLDLLVFLSDVWLWPLHLDFIPHISWAV